MGTIHLNNSVCTRDVYISLIEAIQDDLGLRIWIDRVHILQYKVIRLRCVPVYILPYPILQFKDERLILFEQFVAFLEIFFFYQVFTLVVLIVWRTGRR